MGKLTDCITTGLRRAGPLLAAVGIAATANPSLGQGAHACGELAAERQYGPYDYRTDKNKLGIVEIAHFTPWVENLTRGNTSTIGDDLAYTLRAFPNHHRALISMMNLGFKLKTDRPPGSSHTVSCFFDRAVRFRPDDAMVRVIFGNYLIRLGKKEDAIKQLEFAQELGASGANFEYNLGLAYFEVGQFEKSLTFAHRAYAAGFNLPGLKGKLQKAGKWRDPPPAERADAGAAQPKAEATAEKVPGTEAKAEAGAEAGK